MTAHRLSFIVATAIAVIGCIYALVADTIKPDVIWGLAFATLAVFEFGHWIDTP